MVIDAGHGEDPGATGPGVREKDVCLDVARRLHKELAGREGIYPILTRSRDVLLPLRKVAAGRGRRRRSLREHPRQRRRD
ncbi:MAG: N-acetylmuramoyl-L-alanine amidase [Candidatus Eisenbacteria bacterium]